MTLVSYTEAQISQYEQRAIQWHQTHPADLSENMWPMYPQDHPMIQKLIQLRPPLRIGRESLTRPNDE